ncbi:VanZ family protein [Streptococcus sp. H49]|uniref:VanZ family protein n=1 Tax=Streptococcus huangxiaojuni TaxID=3237239 RepID=UPI0034A43920
MKSFFTQKAELTSLGKKVCWCFSLLYLIFLMLICFAPQHGITGIETPGIRHFGRLVFLLHPFNSLIHFHQLADWQAVIWVLGQNIVNIFLLFPLMFAGLFLFPRLRRRKLILLLSFAVSLAIECLQLLADLLYDANRVFELDDLWTNTLGGLLAWQAYRFILKRFLDKNKQSLS